MIVHCAVRADASSHMGFGHIMRCLTLVKHLKQRNIETTFYSYQLPNTLESKVRSQCRLVELEAPDQIFNPELDVEEQVDVLVLLVDHYGLDKAWEKAMRSFVDRIVVIDDLASRAHDCDLLSDPTCGRSPHDYECLLPSHALTLAGSQYALIDKRYAALREQSLKAVEAFVGIRQMLVMLGGSDQSDVLLLIAKALSALESVALSKITWILGQSDILESDLHQYWPGDSDIDIECLSFTDDIPERCIQADLIIGAAGSATWERCCLGKPSILCVVADNQELIAQNIGQAGAAMIWDSKKGPFELADMICRLNDAAQYLKMSQSAAALCDGRGAERVSDAILKLVEAG